ncbi:hypothetical protein JCGZ_24902 [Jatropha curcas]|uniref:Rx N-terminal domain-containing protein n=2 Tax=Jatropha curcas TaxID=180498 RepID=A0A067L0Z0_JATCU|nr:hypothetical protein JCGZ_24902 [Jatropha curcas]
MTCFFFLLRLLPSFLPSSNPNLDNNHLTKSTKSGNYLLSHGSDSGIARALSQILTAINDIPVSSRKYELLRSLAERVIEENEKENVEILREVNGKSLSAAFERTLNQLEAGVMELGNDPIGNGGGSGYWPVHYGLNRVLKVVRSVKEVPLLGWAGRGGRDGVDRLEEKLAAELLWLAQKLAACGCGEEAVLKWASASNLAWLALSAEPRLQGSLVKVSAFLFKQAKDLGAEETEESKKEQQRQTKKKMLMAWLPLLCRASNGTDIPVLNTSQKAELERELEEMIGMLEHEDEQEQVLSLWLHHFTCCSSSDWPNLQASYDRWCMASRKLLILR